MIRMRKVISLSAGVVEPQERDYTLLKIIQEWRLCVL